MKETQVWDSEEAEPSLTFLILALLFRLVLLFLPLRSFCLLFLIIFLWLRLFQPLLCLLGERVINPNETHTLLSHLIILPLLSCVTRYSDQTTRHTGCFTTISWAHHEFTSYLSSCYSDCMSSLLTRVHFDQNLPLVHLVEVQAVEVIQGELAVADLKHSPVQEELALARCWHGAGPLAGLHQGGRGWVLKKLKWNM